MLIIVFIRIFIVFMICLASQYSRSEVFTRKTLETREYLPKSYSCNELLTRDLPQRWHKERQKIQDLLDHKTFEERIFTKPSFLRKRKSINSEPLNEEDAVDYVGVGDRHMELRRDLNEYFKALYSFYDLFKIYVVEQNRTWVNIGGGALVAEYQALKFISNALSIISVSLQTPKYSLIDKIQKIGAPNFKYFERISFREIPKEFFKNVGIVTDFYSAFAYSNRPDLELAYVADILPTGGYFIFNVGSDFNFSMRDQSQGSGPFTARLENLIYFENKLYHEYPNDIRDFLLNVKGFDIVAGARTKAGKTFVLRRNQDAFSAPQLIPDVFIDNSPPVRAFLWDAQKYQSLTTTQKLRSLWRYWPFKSTN